MGERTEAVPRQRRAVLDAVVVGAGPVALATALGLRQAGRAVVLLVDQAPSPFVASNEVDLRVYALAPDVLDLLDRLGVLGGIRATRACAYRTMQVWDAGSSARLHFAAAEYGWPELGLIVEHALLVDQLWQALGTAGVDVRVTGRERVEWEPAGADGSWFLPAQGLRTRLLLAADGAQSALRAAAGIRAAEHAYGQDGLVAHVRFEQPHQDTAWQRFLPDGTLALLPLADGRCSIVWSLPAAAAQRRRELPAAAFLDELGAAVEGRLGRALESSARRTVPLRRLLAERYVCAPVVLLGDAAHVAHPLAGQGLNLGLRDVDLLLRQLVRVSAGELPLERALAAWERERRSENTLAVRAFEALDTLFRARGPLAALRGVGVNLVNRFGPAKALFAQLAAGRLGRPLG